MKGTFEAVDGRMAGCPRMASTDHANTRDCQLVTTLISFPANFLLDIFGAVLIIKKKKRE